MSGLFGLLVAEPTMDRAVRLEEARTAAEAHAAGTVVDHHADVFSRGTQHLGLVVAATVAGIAFGALFALVYAAVQRREPTDRAWSRSVGLAAAAFAGVWLLPFLRYPANPPGVGDPATVDARTRHWLLAIILGVAAVSLAWDLHRHPVTKAARTPLRHLLPAAVLVVAVVVLFAVLPSNS